MRRLLTELYNEQKTHWPKQGRHILAQHDNDTIVVYQAFSLEIGHFAVKHGHFGEGYRLDRMSWIKTNFLWMMYRSGWGTKENQEVTLAIHLRRSTFHEILSQAVHTSFVADNYETEADWQHALQNSSVRLQWDPDHHPSGAKLERRAIQLGLRGDVLAQYAHNWIIEIEDISEFVREQAAHVLTRHYEKLITPSEWVYEMDDIELKERIGASKTEYDLMTPIEALGLSDECTQAVKFGGISKVEALVELVDTAFDEYGYPNHTMARSWRHCFDEVVN